MMMMMNSGDFQNGAKMWGVAPLKTPQGLKLDNKGNEQPDM